MKNSILIVCSLVLLNSCSDVRTETSTLLHEDAVVVTTIYSPSQHNTEITRTAYDHGSGDDYIQTGTDYNGNTGIKIGENVQITHTTVPEKYGVVFQCSHGTFSIEGSETKHKILYDKLNRSIGDTVDVMYKEMYNVTYEKPEGSKVAVETKRELYKLDFIDAQIKK